MKIKAFVIVACLLLGSSSAYGADYQITNQGNLNACTECAVTTCIDIMGEPAEVNPAKAFKALNADGYQCITETLDYYVSAGAIISYERILKADIDAHLEAGEPVIVVTWHDAADWTDGDITSENSEFYGTHASVLIEKTPEYYIGVNSWGENWGFDGFYHLHDIRIVGAAFVIEVKENVIF